MRLSVPVPINQQPGGGTSEALPSPDLTTGAEPGPELGHLQEYSDDNRGVWDCSIN